MAWERFILTAVIAACILEIDRARRAHGSPRSIVVLVVSDGASHEIEGFIRYLYWEFAVRNNLQAEIALEMRNQSEECAQIADYLLSDGFLVEKASAAPTWVFRVDADTTATG